jgi:type VI secretion system secreted protein Hcp
MITYHLKLEGIKGESKNSKHKDEIELTSWNWSVSNATNRSGGGLSAGRASAGDVSFTKLTDTASPKLLEMCNTGKHIATGVLTCAKSTGDKTPVDYLTLTFKELHISGFHMGGSVGDDVGSESVSFAFGALEYDYKVQGKDGTVSSAGNHKMDYNTVEVG